MVTVSPEDVQFLKDEYEANKYTEFSAKYENNVNLARFSKGIARGLEIALIKLGLSNAELDKIARRTYQLVEEEQDLADIEEAY